MNRFFSSSLISILFLFVSSFSFAQGSKKKTGKVSVVFTTKMSQHDLDSIKQALSAKNIKIEFSNTAFNAKGKLKSLAIDVDCGDGYRGEAAGELSSRKKFGFVRDYDEKAKTPFAIGFL